MEGSYFKGFSKKFFFVLQIRKCEDFIINNVCNCEMSNSILSVFRWFLSGANLINIKGEKESIHIYSIIIFLTYSSILTDFIGLKDEELFCYK